MTRKTKRTITMTVSLLLIIALGGIYFFYQRPEEDPVAAAPPITEFTHLIRLTANDVARVTFHTDGQSYSMLPVEVEGEYGFGGMPIITWQHEDFPDAILDPDSARGKVNLAWSLTTTFTVHECSAGLNLADFGLNPPLLTMEVLYTDNTSKNIYIGSQMPDLNGYFLMLSGDTAIYRITNASVNRATATIEDMIERSLPEFTMHAVYIKIAQRDTPEIEFVLSWEAMENMAQGWTPEFPLGLLLMMAQPLAEWPVLHSALEARLMDNLQFFRIGDVVNVAPTSLVPYGLHNPSLEFIFNDIFNDIHLQFGDIFVYNDVTYIYVKFEDRPHVFKAVYDTMSVLFDFDIFRVIERFIAIVPIVDVESITITSPNPDRNMILVINHEDQHTIHPTINGVLLPDRPFRAAYRQLIGLTMDGEMEPHMPRGEPALTITYHKIEGPDTEVRLFAVDNLFYTASVNGAEAWVLTSRHNVTVFFNYVSRLLADAAE